MFKNFRDSVKEKSVRVKIVATVLVITLTFANIMTLGTYISKGLVSYAANSSISQDSKTNIANVEFDVYLEQTDKNVNTVSKDINTKDLVLYAQVRVKDGGVLKEAKLTVR